MFIAIKREIHWMEGEKMPALNLLIKPASGSCNLRCEYCFYRELYQARDPGSERLMKMDTLEPVSYTHLDVYKRQVIRNPSPGTAQR